MKRVMNWGVGIMAAAMCVGGAMAQWGTDSTNSLIVGEASSDVPAIVAHPDGGCYIAWQGPVGGVPYNTVHLQRLDAAGHEMWAHNGIVVVPGNNTASFVGDFDLAIASDGNALIVNSTNFSDPNNPSIHQANVQKFAAADGHKMWGTGGADVAVTAGAFSARPVHVCSTPDGGCVVGYTLTLASGNGVIRFMRIGPSGTPGWTAPPYPQVIENSGNTSISLVQLLSAGTDGSFVALWGAGVNTSQVGLHTSKFTGAGAIAPGWGTGTTSSNFVTLTTPLTIDSHGMTGHNYYNSQCISDGSGGAIYGWSSFASSGFASPTEAMVQHILSSGAFKFGACCDAGLFCTTTTAAGCPAGNTFTPGSPLESVDHAYVPTTLGRWSASVAYNQAEGSYFVAAGQGPTDTGVVRSAIVQKFTASGVRMYTPGGFVVMPQSSNTQVTVDHVLCTATSDGGCIVMGNVVRGATTTNRVVFSSRVQLDPDSFPIFVWNKLINSDSSTDKGRNGVCVSAGTDDPILTFVWAGRVAAARINAANGAPGTEVDPPTIVVDVPGSVNACEGDTVQLSISVTGTPTISYRWQRHYAFNVAANPNAYWSLNDGNSSYQCTLPDDGTTYSGTQTNTLTIHNVHGNFPTAACPNSDPLLNKYRCYVFNSGDATAYSGEVQIVINGGACCGAAGGSCTFVCTGAACSGFFQGLGTSCSPNPCGGACCAADGSCTSTFSAAQCVGAYQGDGVTCTPSPCPGACCENATGLCTSTAAANCTTGSVFTIAGVCTPNPCPQPGACCNTTNGSCEAIAQPGCALNFHTFLGAGTTCDPTPCPQPGACCHNVFGTCAILTAGACTSSTLGGSRTFLGVGTTCDPMPCPQPGACCNPASGACTSSAQPGCAAPNTFQPGGVCQPNPCPQPAACCDASTGACSIVASPADCAGYIAPSSTSCSPTPCPSPIACCQGASCVLMLAVFCSNPTPNTSCTPNPCQPSGVCCRGATCTTSLVGASACSGSLAAGSAAGAFFATSGATCNASGTTSIPCCYADYNKVGGVSVQDIFDFLNDWFAGRPYANVGSSGGSGVLSVQNIFDFLGAWFSGC
jgi:hypothetical protein